MSKNSYDNSGVLFKNREKEEGSRKPDYTGNITINGEEMRLSAWLKNGKNGTFMSLQVSPKQRGGGQKDGQSKQGFVSNEDIPF